MQKLGIRPAVLLGLKTINDKIEYEERVFIYASIQERCAAEKAAASKIKKGGK